MKSRLRLTLAPTRMMRLLVLTIACVVGGVPVLAAEPPAVRTDRATTEPAAAPAMHGDRATDSRGSASTESRDAGSDLERGLKFFVDGETRKLPGRVEVRLGNLDAKLRLAPCARVEPYLPSGARLWGRTNIGVRCVDGAVRWNVYLPIEVRVFAPALVAVRPIAVGQPIAVEDVESQDVDLTREPPGVLLDPAQLETRVASRAILVGTPLRAEMLRAKPVIAQGDLVKVIYLGTGFTVAGEGKALAAAGAGQSVRVQMESGRIVSGTAREGRQVELR